MSEQKSSHSTEEKTLLDWICLRYPDSPKKRVKAWFTGGRIRFNGNIETKFHLKQPTDPQSALEFVDKDEARKIKGANIRIHQGLRIIYMDNDLAILSKAAGYLSVNAEGRKSPSIFDYLNDHLKKHVSKNARAMTVHRLDEFTSGLICFALNDEARASLIDQVKSHRLERNYIAYVEGRPTPRQGTWQHLLQLDEDGYEQSVVQENGRGVAQARTHYEVLKTYRFPGKEQDREISKIRIRLETGLKHQIRIQAAEEGHPLIGDRTYHPLFNNEENPASYKGLNRHALHAVRLGLTHPSSGEYLKFEVPLTKDLSEFERALKESQET